MSHRAGANDLPPAGVRVPRPRPAPGATYEAQFALAKFRPASLPSTLVPRAGLCAQLDAGAADRLTVVIGSAGSGKSVLLASWAGSRDPGLTSWLCCDEADADPLRFWAGLVQSIRIVVPAFGATAMDLLGTDGVAFADVVACLATDAHRLPAGFAVVMDDFQEADPAVARDMADLVALWPHETVQLVVASRCDPQLRLHRLRMAGELCELRGRDLNFSLQDTGAFLSRFGVDLPLADLARLHQRSEGWPAALQMTALALQTCHTHSEIAHALDVRNQDIAEYFISEVLEQQPPEVASFMLETSVLGELTEEVCAVVSGRPDAGAMLRTVDHAHLFLLPLDDERTRFRYHRLVHDILRAELRRRDRAREQVLQLRAARWYESSGDVRRAARHYLVARDAERALTLLQDQVVTDYLRDPTLPDPIESGLVVSASLHASADQHLALALDLLLSGDPISGGALLDRAVSEGAGVEGDLSSRIRLGLARAVRQLLIGRAEDAEREAQAVGELLDDVPADAEWWAVLGHILLRIHTCLGDHEAAARDAEVTLALPGLAEPVAAVMLPGLRALTQLAEGRLADAAASADEAEAQARRLGVAEHLMAGDHLRALAGIALEQRDLERAQRLIGSVLSLSTGRSPLLEYEAGLDEAALLLTSGRAHEALAAIDTARDVLSEPGPALVARAAALEAQARLSLGDVPSSAELARHVPAPARELLLARVALASDLPDSARERLDALPHGALTPRSALVRELLLAAAAIEQGDSASESLVATALLTARRGGFCNTVVSTAPQVTSYVAAHASAVGGDPYYETLVSAALDVRAIAMDDMAPDQMGVERLTPAEQRVLKLLPTHTYRQIAAALYVSPHTVKSHLRSVYRKIGAESRAEALERAVDLRLL